MIVVKMFLVCFQDWPLALANHLVCSSLGKAVSFPTVSLSSIILCVDLRPPGLSPMHFGTSTDTVFVQVMFRQSCWWDFLGVASHITRRLDHSKLPDPLHLFPKPWIWECFVDVHSGTTLSLYFLCFFLHLSA